MSSSPVTRESLLVRVRDADDREAWGQFVELYTPLIYRYCRKRGLQDADAADVAQDALQSIARAMPGFRYDRDQGTFRSWLFTVTRSKLYNHFGKRQRQPRGTGETMMVELLDAQPSPADEDEWEKEYQKHMFEWACAQVRDQFEPTTWQAFELTAVRDMDPKAAADRLGVSVNVVYVSKSRVLSRLREKIREAEGE